MTHKELYLSPSGKMPYAFNSFTINGLSGLSVAANSTTETGNIAIPGVLAGDSVNNTHWAMSTPMLIIGETVVTYNYTRVVSDGNIRLSFQNYSIGAETVSQSFSPVPIPWLCMSINPPDYPQLKSDFRKSPSGKRIFCYETITVPSLTIPAGTSAEVSVNSECATVTNTGGITYAADYIFAAQTGLAESSGDISFNYAYCPATGIINLRFINTSGGDLDTVTKDWTFLIVKNDGSLGTYASPA